MGVNSLPKTATRQRRGCDLNPGPSAPESSTLTTRLPSHVVSMYVVRFSSDKYDHRHHLRRHPLAGGVNVRLCSAVERVRAASVLAPRTRAEATARSALKIRRASLELSSAQVYTARVAFKGRKTGQLPSGLHN